MNTLSQIIDENQIMINFRKLKVGSLVVLHDIESKQWKRLFAVLMSKKRRGYVFYSFLYYYDENENLIDFKEYKTGSVDKKTLNAYCADGKLKQIIY